MINNNSADSEYYVRTMLNPPCVRLEYYNDLTDTAVNAVAIVTGKPWESVVKCLIEQAHIRGNMPTYKTCVTDMMRAEGMKPADISGTVMELITECGNDMNSGRKFIVRTYNAGYYAVAPDSSGEKYVLRGPGKYGALHLGRLIEEAWEYFPGTDNRTGIKRKTDYTARTNRGNDKFVVKNMNPEDKNTGDCVVRAMSAAYGFTWHDAIDFIAEITQYKDPTLNILGNINIALIKLGFERHKAITRGGVQLDGKQFCDLMDHTYRDGERIFAYVGKSHCAAVLPFEQPDGSCKYKIQDTWDSTTRMIGEYWVYKKPVKKFASRPAMKQTEVCTLEVGCEIEHPKYGKGVITAVSGAEGSRIIEIDFPDVGKKKISETWFKMKA